MNKLNGGNTALKSLVAERKRRCSQLVVSPLAKKGIDNYIFLCPYVHISDKVSLSFNFKVFLFPQIYGFVNILLTYDSKGNLICIICKNTIKSAAIWKVHINSKVHKLNVEEAKKANKVLEKSVQNNGHHVEDAPTPLKYETPVPKAKDDESPHILPEMFFDDPIVDAKIRHVEHKNVQNDEWERFQREIKEESMSSNKLIFGEQTNSALDREITEISEQIYQWSKVIDLENKLQRIVKKVKPCNELDATDENVSDEEFNDYLDWRSKKFS